MTCRISRRMHCRLNILVSHGEAKFPLQTPVLDAEHGIPEH